MHVPARGADVRKQPGRGPPSQRSTRARPQICDVSRAQSQRGARQGGTWLRPPPLLPLGQGAAPPHHTTCRDGVCRACGGQCRLQQRLPGDLGRIPRVPARHVVWGALLLQARPLAKGAAERLVRGGAAHDGVDRVEVLITAGARNVSMAVWPGTSRGHLVVRLGGYARSVGCRGELRVGGAVLIWRFVFLLA